MRPANASLAARPSVAGKNRIVSGSPLRAANGSRSDSVQRRISSLAVRMVSNLGGSVISVPRRESGWLGAQETAEMWHGEGDQAALGTVDQPLLDQAVAGRGDAGRLAAKFLGDLRGLHWIVAEHRHRPHVLPFRRGGALVQIGR